MALDCIWTIEVDELRGASELDIKLQRNNPFVLMQQPQGIEPRRVPDVVIVRI